MKALVLILVFFTFTNKSFCQDIDSDSIVINKLIADRPQNILKRFYSFERDLVKDDSLIVFVIDNDSIKQRLPNNLNSKFFSDLEKLDIKQLSIRKRNFKKCHFCIGITTKQYNNKIDISIPAFSTFRLEKRSKSGKLISADFEWGPFHNILIYEGLNINQLSINEMFVAISGFDTGYRIEYYMK